MIPSNQESNCSHQRYILGDKAMQDLQESRIFLSGLGGLGVEIAKNLLLMGATNLVLHDTKPAQYIDISAQFFLTMEDISKKKNRAEVYCERLSVLNPHAQIGVCLQPLDIDTDLNFLENFQCVILTEAQLDLQLAIDTFCRRREFPIKFLVADTFGAIGYVFCDFGDRFTVHDPDGEEAREFIISHISKDNPGTVTCVETKLYDLESGDTVHFSKIEGMTALNDTAVKIKLINSHSFSICDTTSNEYEDYIGGGIVTKIKMQSEVAFNCLESELYNPSIVMPEQEPTREFEFTHLAMLALHQFLKVFGHLPSEWDSEEAIGFLNIAKNINETKLEHKLPEADELLRKISYTAKGVLPPLNILFGGIAAQEVLKGLTGVFLPFQQWFYMDYSNLIPYEQPSQKNHLDWNRYDAVLTCLGDELMNKLSNVNLFLVGCSSIAFELVKICALLGVSSKQGKIVIADDDVVKELNLNQQAVLQKCHLQRPKCISIAEVAKSFNADLNVEPILHKVSPNTAHIYTDEFFDKQKVILTALDNIESRRYVDSLCVKHRIPMIDSGTSRVKGHVQVVIPHHTESFSSQFDPSEDEIPYCVLKSFPSKIEHTIQWAREKFENFFCAKPAAYSRFWASKESVGDCIQQIDSQAAEAALVMKCLKTRPYSWNECVTLARLQFEKYFNHKAKQLLHAFPLDMMLLDGRRFWQFPKHPPIPIDFDLNNHTHLQFVISMSRLIAYRSGIIPKPTEIQADYVCNIITSTKIPEFIPHSKQIVTDETTEKPVMNEESNDDPSVLLSLLQKLMQAGKKIPDDIQLFPTKFEKDDDSHGQNGFIISASNLRAKMYDLDEADETKIKIIAGKLVPKLATTTSTAAGFVFLELLKLFSGLPSSNPRNCFFNLALPRFVWASPAAAQLTRLSETQSFTLWDRWSIYGTPEFTLQQLIDQLKTKTGLEVTMVVEGTKMIFLPIMPGHTKRLPQTMTSLLKRNSPYIDLSVAFECSDGEETMGPLVRYYLGTQT